MTDRLLPGVEGAVSREVPYLPDALSGGQRVGPYSVARPNALLRIVPGLARFLARDGTVIEVAPEKGADPAIIDSLLQGPLAAALVHQRGELPLHGATLIPPGGRAAVALVGHQGAGKSTLAYELVRRGWHLLSDDLTRITRQGEKVLAWPGRAGIKLCRDACERFSLPAGGMQSVPGERDKFLAPVATAAVPCLLSAIIGLDRENDTPWLDLTGTAALALISKNTFRPNYIGALGQAGSHLEMAMAAASSARISRAGGLRSPGHSADLIAQMAGLMGIA